MGTTEQSVTLDQQTWKDLAAQKEKEWREIQEKRIQSSEELLHSKEEQYSDLKNKFQKLKEDFKYNLRLLGERDAELDRYDSVFTDLRNQLAQKNAEISEAKIHLDSAEQATLREAESRQELQTHYQHRVREKQAELEQYRNEKDAEVQKERSEIEVLKRCLENRVTELQAELETQRRELSSGFDEALRKREHEFRKKADELANLVLAHEMKVKLQSAELEACRTSQQNAIQESEVIEGSSRSLKKQLQRAKWEIEDIKATKDAKIAEIEGKLSSLQKILKKQKEEYNAKYSDQERRCHDLEAAITKIRDAAQEREKQQQEELRQQQSLTEQQELALRQQEWHKQDKEREMQEKIRSLQSELGVVQARWETHITDTSQVTVARDVELEGLRERCNILRAEVDQRRDDIDRYKRELAAAVERESALERDRSQLQLDWQRRYDGVERVQYEKTEQLVKALAQARDEALATVSERDRELQHQRDLCTMLTRERDSALATLRQHGLTTNRNATLPPEIERSTVEDLQQQNDSLRAVISEMRKQMEALGEEMPATNGYHEIPGDMKTGQPKQNGSVAREYVRNLEQELKSMKAQLRKLKQNVKDGTVDMDTEHAEQQQKDALSHAGDNMVVKMHIEELNANMGKLRGEKVELTAQLRQHQARIHHLEKQLLEVTEQPREKQAQIEQLQYELGAAVRRSAAQLSSTKSRVGELELELSESCKQADEYHKANVQLNLEVTSLNNQISLLKMQMAKDRPAVNFGAQELMIQQLQDEIQVLRKQHGQQQQGDSILSCDVNLDPRQPRLTSSAAGTVETLKNKLKHAAAHIAQLAQEKEQLIELGNRLRVQLKQKGENNSAYNRGDSQRNDLQDKIHGKLQQLQQLQYQLTKQKLAHAKPETVSDSNGSTAEDDFQPQSILKRPAYSQPANANMSPVRGGGSSVNHRSNLPQTSMALSDVPSFGSSPTRDLPQVQASMSSIGGESLQELWKMLDREGPSPRPITPSTNTVAGPWQGLQFPGDQEGIGNHLPEKDASQGDHSGLPSNACIVQGTAAPLIPKQSPTQPRKPVTGRSQTGTSISGGKHYKSKTKIRNWNVKND